MGQATAAKFVTMVVLVFVVIIVVVVVVEIGEAVAQILAGVWVAWVLLGDFAMFSPRMIEQKNHLQS